MIIYYQSGFSSRILLILMLKMSSLLVIDTTQANINLPIAVNWSQSATTVVGQANGNSGSSSSYLNNPWGLTITSNDILYIADLDNNRVVKKNLSASATASVIGSGPGSSSTQFNSPDDVFVLNTSLYVLDYKNNRVQKWSISGSNPTFAAQSATVNDGFNIFIDKYNNMYISQHADDKVLCSSPSYTAFSTVAGNGNAGSGSNQLDGPEGIYVDNNLTLYIADCNNNRIQMWKHGASYGTTVAGTGTSGTSLTQLSGPIALVVDTNGYIYITDSGNNRIVRWAPNSNIGVCIVACTLNSGAGSNQLNWPLSIGFDSNGSLYVTDNTNNRVQKFQILASQRTTTTTKTTTTSKTTTITTTTITTTTAKTTTTTTKATITTTTTKPTAATTITPTMTTSISTTLVFTNTILSTTSSLVIPELSPSTAFHTSISLATTKMLTTIDTSTSTSVSTMEMLKDTTVSGSSSLFTSEMLTSTSVYMTTTVSTTGMFTNIVSHTTTTTTTSISTTEVFTEIMVPTSSPPRATSEKSASTVFPTTTTTTVRSTMDITTTTTQTMMSNPLSTPLKVETSVSQTLPMTSISFRNDHVKTSSFADILSSKIRSSSAQLSSESLFTSLTTNDPSTMIKTQSLTFSSIVQMTSTTPSTISSSTSTVTTLNCSTSAISLWPINPSASSPLTIEYSKDFSISSSLQLNCFVGWTFTEKWSIVKCIDSLCFEKDSIDLSLPTMTLSELHIPSKTLSYGLYQMTIRVTVERLVLSTMTYIQIIPSSIEVNLFAYGASIITQGEQQTLLLDPGTFSIDPDQTNFNSSEWNYVYFCRVDDGLMSSNSTETLLPIENSSCFQNSSSWTYLSSSSRSSLLILNGSLQSNQTYHFRVELNSILNSSLIYSGDLLVEVEESVSIPVLIKCVIGIMCVSKNEYQMINPTTQIALTSFTMENVSWSWNIQWNIYYRTTNSSQWTLWKNQTQYQNHWIFGMNSNQLTITTDLFETYWMIKYWRFEVIYSSPSLNSVGLIQFVINSPPSDGTCSISPLNGTTTTLFTILCSNWLDSDGIADYSFYSSTENQLNRLMLGYTTSNVFQVRMPLSSLTLSLINITVQIRDELNCITEFTLPSISITPNLDEMNALMTLIESSTLNSGTSDPLAQILYRGSQNEICQLLTSLSQVLNLLSKQNLQLVINDDIPSTSVSISSFYQNYPSINNESGNSSMNLTEYNHQLNLFSTVEEYLMLFVDNLTIVNINSVILQATTLSQLTSTTNQLTRNALIIASKRCLALSIALFNSSSLVSYEDVQTAVTFIAQSAGNILTAVNGPLQARTLILDLDNSRANSFPSDYDTDLESVWSNPNLFADGKDFSEETINKNRNLYYQQQTANMIMEQFEETMSILSKSLHVHLNVEQSMSLNTSSILITTKKFLSNQTIQLTEENIQLTFPPDLYFNSTVSLRCVQTPLSVVGNPSNGHLNMSNLLFITFIDENSDEIVVKMTNNKSIEFFISRDINLIVPSMILQNVTNISNDSMRNNAQFNLHLINITQMNVNLSFSVHFEIQSLNESVGYMLIYKFDDIPQLNNQMNDIDGWTIFCPNDNNDDLMRYFIDNEKSLGHQSVIFGIRELDLIEFEKCCVNMSDEMLITDRWFQFSTNYQLRIFTSGCYYLDSNRNWQSNGVLVGSKTNSSQTQCLTNHLSTFASGFLVLPKPINWNYVFSHSNFMKNKTIYLTVIIITILFLIIGIFARYLDKKDNQKLGMTNLSDNRSNEKYLYQIVVFTGLWKNAGTNAKVHLIICGDDGETRVRTLTNSKRKICQRGSIDSFLLAVPKSLGLLNYIRIWHDNSNDHPSWFLKHLIIRDLQTLQKHYFICQQWLSIEKDDGKIERLLPASNEKQMRELSNTLSEKAYYSLSDDHLWFSIFSGPPPVNFTRLQRCVCCFVLLYTMMFLNILYYDQTEEAAANRSFGGLSFGPFYFTSQQIGIGLIVDVLTFIPSLILVILFRRTRSSSSFDSSKQNSSIVNQAFESSSSQKTKKKKKNFFPHWCLYVAYGLSFLLTIMSIVLILARGIEFGERKIETWLTSLVTAFFSSVLLSQPIKVLGVAMFVSLLTRRSNDDENEYLDENEEYYLNVQIESLRSNELIDLPIVSTTNPLSKSDVAEKRSIRLREIQMCSYIRHILVYSCFLFTLYLFSYGNNNSNSYLEVNHLRNYFLDRNNVTNHYLEISSIDQYWKWLEESFVRKIRAQSWYNGDDPHYLVGFLNDKTNRLIGWPMMRQLRIKTESIDGTCRIVSLMRWIIQRCHGDYSSSNEDHQSWFPGWNINRTNSSFSSTMTNAFVYHSGKEVNSNEYRGSVTSYDGGGYIYEFRGRLEEIKENLTNLHHYSWIDSSTRAVFIQMTLYNSNVQLFTSVVFLIEFLSSGDVLTEVRFDPIDLHNPFEDFSSTVHNLIGIIYMLFICYFTIIEIRSLIKFKIQVLYSVRSLIEWGIILCSWTSLIICIWRFQEYSHLNQILHQSNGYSYLNIQRIVDANNMLMFLLGFCCFLCTIKYLYLFRFNTRLSQFGQTLRYVQKDLFYFGCTFGLVFVSFLCLFYLLFNTKTESCSDVSHTSTMLLEMLLLKFNLQDLVTADSFLGPLAFTLYIYFVVFICCTMIISIINNGFRCVRKENKQHPHSDEDVLMFIWLKIKPSLGMKNEKNDERKEQTSLEQLADRLDHLNRILEKSKRVLPKRPSMSLKNSDIYVEDLC